MVNESQIDGVMVKVNKEYRWCEEIFSYGFIYAYKDILSEKNYAPRDCVIIQRKAVKISVVEMQLDEN